MNTTTQFFQTNITTKLRFPSHLTDNYWAIEDFSNKTLYAIPFIAVLTIVACTRPITKSSLQEFLLSKIQLTNEQLENTLQNLISKNIIHLTNHQKHQDSLVNNFLNWKKGGWGDAANYHFFTWDISFLDYTKEGQGYDIDRKKMIENQNVKPDTERYKQYNKNQNNIVLPSLNTSIPFPDTSNLVITEKIKCMLSCAFAKKGEKPCYWTDTPLIKRTSPSGGGRHPTEGYFISFGLQDITKGLYHIQTEPAAICLISSNNQKFLDKIIEKNDLDLPLCGAIILTSVFERNMYRYREPRTFRTIHMDIGHILATIEMFGNEFGIKTRIHLNFDEDLISEQIDASKLEEGFMAIVTLHEDKF
jgi:SagB-type dehydrogenase family enzyme